MIQAHFYLGCVTPRDYASVLSKRPAGTLRCARARRPGLLRPHETGGSVNPGLPSVGVRVRPDLVLPVTTLRPGGVVCSVIELLPVVKSIAPRRSATISRVAARALRQPNGRRKDGVINAGDQRGRAGSVHDLRFRRATIRQATAKRLHRLAADQFPLDGAL